MQGEWKIGTNDANYTMLSLYDIMLDAYVVCTRCVLYYLIENLEREHTWNY